VPNKLFPLLLRFEEHSTPLLFQGVDEVKARLPPFHKV